MNPLVIYTSNHVVGKLQEPYNTIQYNTKSLFRNGGHRPIIQNSHNTILTMSGKLEISYLSYLIRLGKILFKLVSWKSVFMVLTHNKSSTRVAR